MCVVDFYPNCRGRHCAHDIHCLTRPATPCVTVELPDRMAHCPCRVENGGSGICGCVLGGLQVTC